MLAPAPAGSPVCARRLRRGPRDLAAGVPGRHDVPSMRRRRCWSLASRSRSRSLTGVIFGAAPAIVGSRADPLDAMRGAGRTTGERGSRLRRSLIALQVALSLVLIACAGLLGRSLQQLESQDFGFRPTSRYVVYPSPSLATVPAERAAGALHPDAGRAAHVPGVTQRRVLALRADVGRQLGRADHRRRPRSAPRTCLRRGTVSVPRYFDTVGTPLVRGRAFDERDGAGRAAGCDCQRVVRADVLRRHRSDRPPHRLYRQQATGARDIGDRRHRRRREVPGRQARAPIRRSIMPFLQPASPNGAGGLAKLDRSHYPQAIEVHTAARCRARGARSVRRWPTVDSRLTVRDVLSMDGAAGRRVQPRAADRPADDRVWR